MKDTEKPIVEFHELAHYFLHRGDGNVRRKWNKEMSDYQEWKEVEANAAAFVAVAPTFKLGLFLEYVTPFAMKREKKGGAR